MLAYRCGASSVHLNLPRRGTFTAYLLGPVRFALGKFRGDGGAGRVDLLSARSL